MEAGEFGAGASGRVGVGDTGERPRNEEWLRVALQAAECMERGEINKPNHRGNTALMTAASHAYP